MSFLRKSGTFFRSTLIRNKFLVQAVRHAQPKNAVDTFKINADDNGDKITTTLPNTTVFPGAQAPFIHKPTLRMPESVTKVPIYRVMDANGVILDGADDPQLPREMVTKMFRDMTQLSIMESTLLESQRQGRLTFFMTSAGEEATHIGSAAAMAADDLIYAQYRESGVLVWRGFSIADFVNQCYGNVMDLGKGRQMPIHYGSKELHFVTISSPLATQMPQAVGAAYVFKLRPNNQRIVCTYFGEGTASEGDAHAAFNFAATLECPVVLFCRNNGYACSTPTTEQYRGDGIAGRAAGYGIAAIRVDGTDIFAVYNAMRAAREYALHNNKPVVLEAMAYRVGDHSSAEDSSEYRSLDGIDIWKTIEHPASKLKNYMVNKQWWNEKEEADFAVSVKRQVLEQISLSKKMLKPKWTELFGDVYDEMTPHLKAQQAEMEAHVELHKEHYPLENYQK